jgi:polysaccharide biosynthesis/export protein
MSVRQTVVKLCQIQCYRPLRSGDHVRSTGHEHARLLILSCLLTQALASGCGGTPPVISKPLPSPVTSTKQEVLDPKLFHSALGEREGDAYRVGPGDSLLVAVYGHPELSIATYAGTYVNGGRPAGYVIDNDGTIQFPLIGSVRVAGKTTEELRVFLETQLVNYLREPHVTVQLSFNGSIRYYLLGQFTQPGLKFSDRPMHLMEALALGGSVILEKASLHGAYVARNGKRLPIDFQRLLREGDLTHNIPLKSGDVVFVPDNAGDEVFVFGGVVGERAGMGAVPFINGRLDILQALAQAGFGFRERSQGVLSETHVIRSYGDRATLFIVDVERILDGEAASFHLMPGDLIFVPTTALTDWNMAMQQILPTLQAFSGLLTPFVQIKYLRE